jgi:hypothetical protein
MRTDAVLAPVSWQRMIAAVEKVRNRLLRAVKALEQAKVPYAIAGGNAVAAWVSRVDEGAVRNTRDVDILLRRADLASARQAHKDRTHLRDLIEVGLLDSSMLDGLPTELRRRLQIILQTPEG